jgi:hypothetical protein
LELISVCVPIHNRTYDLKRTLPHLIMAANSSPPIEIVILDYNSPDDLQDYVCDIIYSGRLSSDNTITYRKYTGRDHYHMAHARNLSVMAASGETIVISSADIYPIMGFFRVIRTAIASNRYNFYYVRNYRGVIACKRSDFIMAGGYDERFEFYSPEDQDLHLRFLRRGMKGGAIADDMIRVIKTPDDDKIKNYRLQISKREMAKQMSIVLEQNIAYNVMVANEGIPWGQWT